MLSLILQLAVAAAPDSTRLPMIREPAAVVAEAQDTTRHRARAVEVGDWYHRRLVVHKALSFAMIPVFAAQYLAGSQLYDAEQNAKVAPSWARPVHRFGSKAIAGIFGVNTATGVWNLWDSRHVPEHRWLRTTHAIVMLGADAAFAYTGIKLADEAQSSSAKRRQHRQVALISIGVSSASGLAMYVYNR